MYVIEANDPYCGREFLAGFDEVTRRAKWTTDPDQAVTFGGEKSAQPFLSEALLGRPARAEQLAGEPAEVRAMRARIGELEEESLQKARAIVGIGKALRNLAAAARAVIRSPADTGYRADLFDYCESADQALKEHDVPGQG